MEERVADGDVEREVGRVREPRDPRDLQRRDEEAEARDGDGVGVEVDAVDGRSARCTAFAADTAGRRRPPERDEPVKRAEEEVAAAAGGVDEADLLVAELLDRRRERPVEDELLDELGRLEQRVALAGGLGEVLVEVAEEAGPVLRVGEVVDEDAGRSSRLCQNSRRRRAPSAERPRVKAGLWRSSKRCVAPGSAPTSPKTARRTSRSEWLGKVRMWWV